MFSNHHAHFVLIIMIRHSEAAEIGSIIMRNNRVVTRHQKTPIKVFFGNGAQNPGQNKMISYRNKLKSEGG
jgi:hypothetical protein